MIACRHIPGREVPVSCRSGGRLGDAEWNAGQLNPYGMKTPGQHVIHMLSGRANFCAVRMKRFDCLPSVAQWTVGVSFMEVPRSLPARAIAHRS